MLEGKDEKEVKTVTKEDEKAALIDEETGMKVKVENVKHDIYGWGRGYH